MAVLLGVMTVVALACVIYANFARFPADVDPDNLFEGRKNSCSLLRAARLRIHAGAEVYPL